jgi:GNAT superfamily N-acetyltransferase
VAIRVRRARRGDEPAVAELHVRCWKEAYRGLWPDDFVAALDPREHAPDYEFESTEEGALETLLAVEDETIAGFVTFGVSRDEDAPGLGEVAALYVDPDRHRAGIGSHLMADARRNLRECGHESALLWVLDGNARAREFYEREGWVPDGSTRTEQPYGAVSHVSRFRREL